MKKLLYILILFTLIGLFGSIVQVNAEEGLPTDPGICTTFESDGFGGMISNKENTTRGKCAAKEGRGVSVLFVADGGTGGAEKLQSTPKSAPAPTPAPAENTIYTLLAPLPCPTNQDGIADPNCEGGKLTNFDTTKGLGNYLNLMIKLFIGLAAVLSVVMIVVGGLEYMTSELPGNKGDGKEKIIHAILGLLIALGAYALLFTINPDLLQSDVDKKIPNTTVVIPAVTPAISQGYCDENAGLPEQDCKDAGLTWIPNP